MNKEQLPTKGNFTKFEKKAKLNLHKIKGGEIIGSGGAPLDDK